ncbi:MAG: hypothetical protein K0V04_29810, partial [Deltaproteobacteria bacterium]|nr:hypothetical protein [Deltaproteobacteria bacterium]
MLRSRVRSRVFAVVRAVAMRAAVLGLVATHGGDATAGPANAMPGHGPSTPMAAPQPWPEGPLSPRNANYTMEVRFDPDAKTIAGNQVLRWTNITERPTEELRYHLYYNAWRNDDSSFVRWGLEQGRSRADVAPDDWAYVDVHTLELLGGEG